MNEVAPLLLKTAANVPLANAPPEREAEEAKRKPGKNEMRLENKNQSLLDDLVREIMCRMRRGVVWAHPKP